MKELTMKVEPLVMTTATGSFAPYLRTFTDIGSTTIGRSMGLGRPRYSQKVAMRIAERKADLLQRATDRLAR